MGTRGFKVVRFRGRYYITYQQFDSYPEGLGIDHSNEIPKDAAMYEQWLRQKLAKYEMVEYELFELGAMKETQSIELPRESFCVKPIDVLPSERNYALLTYFPPFNTLFIEWTWIIDLDRQVYTCQNKFHTKMQNFPKEYLQHILPRLEAWDKGTYTYDASVDAPVPVLVAPSLTPPSYFSKAGWEKYTIEERPLNSREELSSRLLRYFFFTNPNLTSKAGVGRSMHEYWRFIRWWTADDPAFKQIAFMCLLLADSYSFTFRPLIMPSMRNEFDSEPHVGEPQYYRDQFACSFPTTSTFMFAGAFIRFQTHLTDLSVLGHTILDCASHLQGAPHGTPAIILSLSHLVVVSYSATGTVQYTDPLPFTPSLGDGQLLPAHYALIQTFTKARKMLAAQSPLAPYTRLPAEILSHIAGFTGRKGARALRGASRRLREIVDNQGPRIGPFCITRLGEEKKLMGTRKGDGEPRELELKKAKEGKRAFHLEFVYPGVEMCGPPVYMEFAFGFKEKGL